MEKEKLQCLVLWGIVAYAVALLIYFSLKAFGHGADFISAFGSILSATAAFFAAYVAITLFSDWRDPANHSIKKEQVFRILGVTAQLRFQLSYISEALLLFKKTKEFVVLNDQYLAYDHHNLKKQIFEVVASVKYLSPNIFNDYSENKRHFTYVEMFYIQCKKEYEKYYQELSKDHHIQGGEIYVNPYKNYTFYGVDQNNNYADKLLRALSKSAGYQVVNDGELVSGYAYKDLSEMVNTTINLINEIDISLLKELKIK